MRSTAKSRMGPGWRVPLAALVSGAMLAGCGGGSRPTRGDAIEARVPAFPGAEVVEREKLPRRTTEEGRLVGGGTRIVFRLPPGAGPAAVARFYRERLEPDWRLAEELDGPVLNFRRGPLMISVNLENWRTHEMEVAAGHEEARPVDLVLERLAAQAGFAFTVNRDGFGEIWLMDENGGNRRRLTPAAPRGTDASGSTSPAWSPDGSLIAFASSGAAVDEDQEAIEIHVMAADGSGERRLTDDRVGDGMPAWSPDGRRIAFAHAAGLGTAQAAGVIMIMDADGGNPIELTQHARGEQPMYDLDPTWSPDGRLIAFTRVSLASGEPQSAIYVVKADGNDERLLLADAAEPAWSPDGTRLAFTSVRDRNGEICFHECGPSGEIYVANRDRTGLRRLTKTQANDGSPAWSLDGDLIAFVSDRSDRNRHENEIYVMRADGSGLRRLTRNDVWDLEPVWRP